MKRPEALGGPARPAPAPAERVASSRPRVPMSSAPVRERPSRPAPDRAAPERPAAPRPTPKRPARDRPSRVPKPAGDRASAADIRAALRARRREERQEVRRFTRRARRRRIGWLAGAGLFVVLVLIIVGAVYSPLLALRTITVDGTNRLSAATLEKALAPNLGTPLALLDDARIKAELGRYRLIRSYVTELQPPDKLVVHITERMPVGVIQGADDFQLVDPAGVVVDRSATRPDGVPLIQLGSAPLDGPGYASMAQVLLSLPTDLRGQVDTIAALTHDDVTLTLRGSGQKVIWGSADQSALKAQVLARLVALHGQSGTGTYTVSAPQFAVFNPADVTTVGGTDGGAQLPSPQTAPTPNPTSSGPTDGTDQGGVQR